MIEDNGISIKELLLKATEAEKNKDNNAATELYRQVIKTDNTNTHAYNRLMKIYRALKDYKKELATINSGITAYEKFYKTHSKKHSKKVNELSEKLNKSFGLTGKKAIEIYNPEPIAGWKKRKETVEKKMKGN